MVSFNTLVLSLATFLTAVSAAPSRTVTTPSRRQIGDLLGGGGGGGLDAVTGLLGGGGGGGLDALAGGGGLDALSGLLGGAGAAATGNAARAERTGVPGPRAGALVRG